MPPDPAALHGGEVGACFPGVHYVFDTAFSRNFSLLESQREFVQRFRGQANSTQALPVLTSACPGVSVLLDAGSGSTGGWEAVQASGKMASLAEGAALRVP